MKSFRRLTALVLSICLLLQVCPIQVFATEKGPSAGISPDTASCSGSNTEQLSASDFLSELDTLRTETVRHFQLQNGTSLAVAFSFPVCYKAENGNYELIDNSLILDEAAGVYTNRAGFVSVALPAVTDGNSAITYRRKDCAVSFIPAEVEAVPAVHADVNVWEKGSPESVIYPEHLTEALRYIGVRESTDYVYTIDSDILKEEIVLSAPTGNYAYTFLADFGSLTPAPAEDGTIALQEEGGNTVLEIPAGEMWDASGAYSSAVTYTLSEAEDGKYLFTVTADEAWISSPERAFPVTIDPTIRTAGYYNIETGTINSRNPDGAASQKNVEELGRYADDKYCRIMVRVSNPPALPPNSYVVAADLKLYTLSYNNTGMDAMRIQLQPLESCFPVSGYYCIYHSWNNCPPCAATVIDYADVSVTAGYRTLTITPEALKWYNDPACNYGMLLLPEAEQEMTASYTAHCGVGSSSNGYSSARPVFYVEYRSSVGVEDYYTARSVGIDRAGTAYIGDYSGQLTVIREDVYSASTVNPLSVAHVYNSAYGASETGTELGGKYTGMKMGCGWKLNIMQSVVASGSNLIWTDGDGTKHYFIKPSGSSAWYDEDGLGLKITVYNDNYTMTDRKGGKMYFTSGKLAYIQDASGNRINIELSGTYDRIRSVTRQNNGGTEVTAATFSYNGSSRLTGITDEAGRTTAFTYDSSGRLTSVQLPDGNTIAYTYNSAGRMTKAQDNESGYSVSFSYNENTGKVIQYTEKGGSASGGTVAVNADYGEVQTYRWSGKNRVLRDAQHESDTDDILTSFVFDYFGRTITSYTTNYDGTVIYGASAARYSINSGTSKTNNRLAVSADPGVPDISESLLENGDMAGNSGWTGGSYAADAQFGHALQLTGKTTEERNAYQTITVNEPGTKTWMLTGWGRAASVPLKETGDRSFGLSAVIAYTDGTDETQSVSFSSDTTAWQYAVLPIVPRETEKTVESITIRLDYDHNANTAYFTRLTLTEEEAATYTYNSEGDLVSVKASQHAEAGYTYSGADLIAQVMPDGSTLNYTYDSAHRVTEAGNDSVQMNLTYDSVGNTTSSVYSGTGTSLRITSSAAYTADKNRIASQTDARGNTVTYTYGNTLSEQQGMPTSVTDAAGNTVETGYNNQNGRIISTGDGTAELEYTYAAGQLSQIQRTAGNRTQNVTYTYNNFGNLLSTTVGGRTIAANTYSNRNGPLNRVTYGNGNYTQYVYDDLERITKIYYNGNSGENHSVYYSYRQDSSLSEISNRLIGRKITYGYDTLGRLLNITEQRGGSTVLTAGTNYDNADRTTGYSYRISPCLNGALSAERCYAYTYNTEDGSLNEITTPGNRFPQLRCAEANLG